MKIEELLDKYFEGETSCEEERELRRFFTEEEVPEQLQTYRPLFAYLAQEATSANEQNMKEKNKESSWRRHFHLHRALYALSGMAAGILLLYGIGKLIQPPASVPENFVIIDGVRHTDKNLAKAKAQEALQMVGFTDEDLNNLLFGH